MDEAIFTTHQISRGLRVDITTVMSWINQGKLSAWRTPGGHRRVTQKNLVGFLRKFEMPIPQEFQKKTTRILLIDDDPKINQQITKGIKRFETNIEVKYANDGFEAGRLMESFAPDLVILDIMLPRIDGFRICKNIRTSKKTKNVRIVAVSDHTKEDMKEEILKCGADRFMKTPISDDVMVKSIATLLALPLR